MATAEFSKFAGILSAALSQHHLSGFEIAQLEFYYQKKKPPKLLFIPVNPVIPVKDGKTDVMKLCIIEETWCLR